MDNVLVHSKPDHPPQNFFESANFPSPGHKENAKSRPLGQKNREKPHPWGNYFQKSSKKHKT